MVAPSMARKQTGAALPKLCCQSFAVSSDHHEKPAVEAVGGLTRYLARPERSEWMWVGDELLLEVAPGTGAVMTRHIWGAGGYQGYYRETSLMRLALHERLVDRVRSVTPPLGAQRKGEGLRSWGGGSTESDRQ